LRISDWSDFHRTACNPQPAAFYCGQQSVTSDQKILVRIWKWQT
jgi:hypothetical protein